MKPNISIWNVGGNAEPGRASLTLPVLKLFLRISNAWVQRFSGRSVSLQTVMSLSVSSAACYISVKVNSSTVRLYLGQGRAATCRPRRICSSWFQSADEETLADCQLLQSNLIYCSQRCVSWQSSAWTSLSCPLLYGLFRAVTRDAQWAQAEILRLCVVFVVQVVLQSARCLLLQPDVFILTVLSVICWELHQLILQL